VLHYWAIYLTFNLLNLVLGHSYVGLFLLDPFRVMVFELRTSCLLDRVSTTWATPPDQRERFKSSGYIPVLLLNILHTEGSFQPQIIFQDKIHSSNVKQIWYLVKNIFSYRNFLKSVCLIWFCSFKLICTCCTKTPGFFYSTLSF
jgi:hypothetical protein